jgi:GAF domain-containing protein
MQGSDLMADIAELERQIAEKNTEIAELRRQLQDQVNVMKQLVEVTTSLNSTLNLGELLQLIMVSTAELLKAETSSLMLVDEETGELTFDVVTGDTAHDIVKQRVPPGRGIAGWVVEHGQPAIIDNPAADERFYRQIDDSTGFETRNMLAVPLAVKDHLIGVIEVINKVETSGFSQTDLELATALASQAAIAIDNAVMYARLADAVVESRQSYRL